MTTKCDSKSYSVVRTVLRAIGSLKLAAIILVLLCIAMGSATAYETVHGSSAALIVFYRSWWFEGLLGLLAVNVLASLLSRIPWSRRQIGFVMTHVSLLTIFAGAWVTKQWSIEGQISLINGQSATQFRTDQDALTIQRADEKTGWQFDLKNTGSLWATDSLHEPAIAVDDLQFVVSRYEPQYVPDSHATNPRMTERVAAPAIFVTMGRTIDQTNATASTQETRSFWLQKYKPIPLRVGDRFYRLIYGDKFMPLDFEVHLDQFSIGHYPGTGQPRSFESRVTLTSSAGTHSADTRETRTIRMNHPAHYAGYSLFQSSYQRLPNGQLMTTLRIAHDPGQPIVFAGYVGTVVGMLIVLFTRLGDMRKPRMKNINDNRANTNRANIDRNKICTANLHDAIVVHHHAAIPRFGIKTPGMTAIFIGCLACLIYLATIGINARAADNIPTPVDSTLAKNAILPSPSSVLTPLPTPLPALPQHLDVNILRAIPVQHDGRIMPLDTLARDVVWSVTGHVHYRGQDPVRWLLAWTFDPHAWLNEPIIHVTPAELRSILQLPTERTEFSYNELATNEALLKIFTDLSHPSNRQSLDPLQSKASTIRNQIMQLRDVFQNDVIAWVPDATDPMAAWSPIDFDFSENKPDANANENNTNATTSASETVSLSTTWTDLQAAFVADDAATFADASQRLANQLAAQRTVLSAANSVDLKSLKKELLYNRLQPYSIAWKLMLVGTGAATIAIFVQRRWLHWLTLAVILAGFAMLTYGITLRGQIAGRLPAANMFESLLFLSWGAGLFSLISLVFSRDRIVPLTSVTMATIALLLADVLPIDPFIRPIAPVLLDTPWMTIHVPGIMAAYAVLAIAALLAHVQILTAAALKVTYKRRLFSKNFIDRLSTLHYGYLLVGTTLLATGIMTGSMWAAASWGRYWGWDPKEVWSLIAFVAYMTILHVRADRERTPGWAYAVAIVLTMGTLYIIVPHLMPLTPMKTLGIAAATIVGILFVTLRGPLATAFKSSIAFWFILMTYLGVNYVLNTGLHSYGFGTGAVAHYMLLIGGIDLAIVTLLAILYCVRSSSHRNCNRTALNTTISSI